MDARSKVREITEWLEAELARLGPGDRLPTVHMIMRRFGTAQRNVERALAPFRAEGRLVARRRAGLVVADPAEVPPDPAWDADLLVMYRLTESRLAHHLLQQIDQRLRQRGTSIRYVGYATEDQAIAALAKVGRFRTCLVQVNFESMSIPFLGALSTHAAAFVIDGVSTAGILADAIGTDWREGLGMALGQLRRWGHRDIAFLTSSHSSRPIAMARREYQLQMATAIEPGPGWLIEIDKLPGAYRDEDILAALGPYQDSDGRFPFTALVVWGNVDGNILERSLRKLDLRAGRDLSVTLLGSVDFPGEHLARFDIVGNSMADKIDRFEEVLLARIAGSATAPKTHYLPVRYVVHGSVVDLTEKCAGR